MVSKLRRADQWKSIENPDMKVCKYSQLILDRSQEYNGGRKITSINGAVKTENEFRSASHTLYKKSTQKWIKDLNVKPKILKLLEENRQCPTNAGVWKDFVWDSICPKIDTNT